MVRTVQVRHVKRHVVGAFKEFIFRYERHLVFNGQVVATSDGFKRLKGYIGLQGESGQVEFRNIRIKTLGKK